MFLFFHRLKRYQDISNINVKSQTLVTQILIVKGIVTSFFVKETGEPKEYKHILTGSVTIILHVKSFC